MLRPYIFFILFVKINNSIHSSITNLMDDWDVIDPFPKIEDSLKYIGEFYLKIPHPG